MPMSDPVAVVRALGPVAVLVRGEPAPSELLWRKNLALLLYLARSPQRGRARDHLIGLLWADKDEQAARHSLREAIRTLRRALGDGAIDATRMQVRLGDGAVQLDVTHLEEAAGAGEWARAAELVGGEFLEGFGVPDASAFEDWLAAERAHWTHRGVEVLARASEEALNRGDVAGAVGYARRAVALDALSEPAVRALIRALAITGDRGAALSEVAALTDRLRAAGVAKLEPETEALATRIRSQRISRPRDAAMRAEDVSRDDRRAPLVGRESELATLGTEWRNALEGHATLLVVEGDGGLGKSRVVDELVARAGLDGATTAVVRAVQADMATPWSVADGLALGGLFGAPGAGGADPGALAAFAGRLPTLVDRFPSIKSAEAWEPGRGFRELVRAVIADTPALLVVDDAQWCDPESLKTLDAAMRDLETAPFALVLAYSARDAREDLEALRARIGRDLSGGAVVLRPLDTDGLRTLAVSALPSYGAEDMDRLVRRLQVDSAGLPLLAVELLHGVALGLELRDADAAWPAPFRTLDETLPGDLPDPIVAAIRTGFRGLGAEVQQVLAAASVLGDRFTAGRVARAAELDEHRVTDALDLLEWTRWITFDPRGYAFTARIVRDVIARDMVTPGQKQRMLERVGGE